MTYVAREGRDIGDIYEGEWVADKMEGRGTFFWSNGDVYEGEWAAGKRHGMGRGVYGAAGQVLQLDDTVREVGIGDTYAGEWKADQPTGNGRWTASGGNYQRSTLDQSTDNSSGTCLSTSVLPDSETGDEEAQTEGALQALQALDAAEDVNALRRAVQLAKSHASYLPALPAAITDAEEELERMEHIDIGVTSPRPAEWSDWSEWLTAGLPELAERDSESPCAAMAEQEVAVVRGTPMLKGARGFDERDIPASSAIRRSLPQELLNGALSCKACGGDFHMCKGSYGMRDGNGEWREETSASLDRFPESPNSNWCCQACEDAGKRAFITSTSSSSQHRTRAPPSCPVSARQRMPAPKLARTRA